MKNGQKKKTTSGSYACSAFLNFFSQLKKKKSIASAKFKISLKFQRIENMPEGVNNFYRHCMFHFLSSVINAYS